MALKKLSSISDLEYVAQQKDAYVVFKNSLTCPISKQAFSAYTEFAEHQDEPAFYLNVQESRELSDYIGETFDIRHETPQVLVINGEDVTWHASHHDISENILKKHVK